MKINAIWWRRVTRNDYFNIEKHVASGPRGQLHIDVPQPALLRAFLSLPVENDANRWEEVHLDVGVIWDPAIRSEVVFRPRAANKRYDIPRQNRFSEDTMRHPAWTAEFGWPVLASPPASKEAAASVVDTGLTIYVARDDAGLYHAGFTRGRTLPVGWPEILQPLFTGTTAGLIDTAGASLDGVHTLAAPLDQANPRAGDLDLLVVTSAPAAGAPPRSGGQGYGLTPEERRAVERRAMDVAMQYFESNGFEGVTDVGATKSWDLEMSHGGQKYIVEVKGSTSAGQSIFLTRNEVAAHKTAHPNNFLAVVTGIRLEREGVVHAVDGQLVVVDAWKINDASLEAVVYRYQLRESLDEGS